MNHVQPSVLSFRKLFTVMCLLSTPWFPRQYICFAYLFSLYTQIPIFYSCSGLFQRSLWGWLATVHPCAVAVNSILDRLDLFLSLHVYSSPFPLIRTGKGLNFILFELQQFTNHNSMDAIQRCKPPEAERKCSISRLMAAARVVTVCCKAPHSCRLPQSRSIPARAAGCITRRGILS